MAELRLASEAQGIQHYALPKMSGAQFIGHRGRAFKIFHHGLRKY